MFCEYHATALHITWQYWIIESIMKQSLYIIYNNNLQYTTCHWFYIASVALQHSNTVPYALQELCCTQETVPLKGVKGRMWLGLLVYSIPKVRCIRIII